MKIKKEIELNIERKGQDLYIGDLPTLQIVMGTVAVQGNLHHYDVEKIDTKAFKGYKVNIKRVKEQIKRMEDRIKSIESKIYIMKQIIGGKLE